VRFRLRLNLFRGLGAFFCREIGPAPLGGSRRHFRAQIPLFQGFRHHFSGPSPTGRFKRARATSPSFFTRYHCHRQSPRFQFLIYRKW
jgi:hypothetical protein